MTGTSVGGGAWDTRLRSLLGAAPAELTEADIDRAVSLQVSENEDLDFKEAHYGSKDEARRELASDVAAMANHKGGIILIGVREKDGLADSKSVVDVSDAIAGRMRQIIASNTAPFVPTQISPIQSSVEGKGFYAVVIPPSREAPHAVVVDGYKLRYPRRDGTTRRWLSEAEVADQYRGRFRGQARLDTRLEEVKAEGVQALVRDEPRIELTLVPSNAALSRYDAQRVEEIKRWSEQFAYAGSDVSLARFFRGHGIHAGIQYRRLAMGRREGLSDFRPPFAHLHVDGALFAAYGIYPSQIEPASDEAPWLADEAFLWEVAIAVYFATRWAIDQAGAYGDALAELRIAGLDALRFGSFRGQLPMPYEERLELPVGSSRTIPLGGADSLEQSVLAATHLLTWDLVQAAGIIQLPQFDESGGIRPSSFKDADAMTAWAAGHGVPVLDS